MSKSHQTPYEVLGIAPSATLEDIRAAYKELVAKYHPDHHAGHPLEELAAEKLVQVNEAYAILSDPSRRAAYDAGMREPYIRSLFTYRGAGSRWDQTTLRKWAAGFAVVALLIRFGPVLARLLRFAFIGVTRLIGFMMRMPILVTAVALVLSLLTAWWIIHMRRRKR